MNAINTMKHELNKIQTCMGECISEDGYVYNHCKHRYQLLVEKAMEFRNAIIQMEKWKEEGWKV